MRNILHEAFTILIFPISGNDHVVEDIYVRVQVIPSGLGLGSKTF